MIHRWEELADIGLEYIPEATGKILAAINGRMGSLSLAARIGIANERRLEDRLQHTCQGVMDDAISIGGGTDKPFFGLVNVKRSIVAGSIGLLL